MSGYKQSRLAGAPEGVTREAAENLGSRSKARVSTHTKLFVYGTLRAGFYNHRLLRGRATYLGRGATRCLYRMNYARGGNFPVVYSHPYGRTIHGEVYTVTDAALRDMDALELPYGYRRAAAGAVNIVRGCIAYVADDVQIYVVDYLTQPDNPRIDFDRPILTGDFAKEGYL